MSGLPLIMQSRPERDPTLAFLAASLLLSLVGANYLLHRDVMYPGFLQAALWFAAVSMLLLSRTTFVPVSDGVYVVLVAGVIFFSIGAFVGSFGHRPYLKPNHLRRGTVTSNRAMPVLMGTVLVGLIAYVGRVQQLASSGPTSSAFINLRYAVSVNPEETGGFGLVAYFVAFANVLATVTILKRFGQLRPDISRLMTYATVLIAFVFGILTSGRGPLLFVLIIVLTIPTVLRVTTPIKTATVLLMASLIAFVTIGIALGKGGSLKTDLRENVVTLRESFLTYGVGSIPAFGTFLSNRGPEVDLGLNSLRTVAAVSRRLGFQTTVVPLVQPFVDVPMPHNVYTVFHPYVKDFGIPGALAMLFVFGFLHSWIYRKATIRTPTGLAVGLFAFSMFPLMMQVFQDSYLSLLSTWVQYGIHAVLCLVVLRDRSLLQRQPDRAIVQAGA